VLTGRASLQRNAKVLLVEGNTDSSWTAERLLGEPILLGLNLVLVGLLRVLCLLLWLAVDSLKRRGVRLPIHASSLRKSELALHNFLDFQAARPVHSSPHTQNILVSSDAENRSAQVLPSIAKLITHDGQHQVLPIPVSNAFLQSDVPLSTVLVLLVFPNRPDSFLKQMIIAHVRQCAWPTQVSIHSPELFYRPEVRNLVSGLFVVLEFIPRRAVPHYPCVLERVKILHRSGNLLSTSNHLRSCQSAFPYYARRRGSICSGRTYTIAATRTRGFGSLEPERAKSPTSTQVKRGRSRFGSSGRRGEGGVGSVNGMEIEGILGALRGEDASGRGAEVS